VGQHPSGEAGRHSSHGSVVRPLNLLLEPLRFAAGTLGTPAADAKTSFLTPTTQNWCLMTTSAVSSNSSEKLSTKPSNGSGAGALMQPNSPRLGKASVGEFLVNGKAPPLNGYF
jgi:hypothetical protein